MRTRENVHLTILRQRILIRYTDTEAKFSRQMQPRKCAPTAYLCAQLLAFCTRSTFCTRSSKPVAEFWLHIWLILTRVLHTSRSESASAHKKQCLVHSSFSSCSLFDFSPFSKKCTRFRRHNIAAHRWRWCNSQNSCKYRCYSRFILHSRIKFRTFNSAPHNQMKKKIKQNFDYHLTKRKKKLKMKRQSEWLLAVVKKPGNVRARTEFLRAALIRVNRFIESAKSSSSCFF